MICTFLYSVGCVFALMQAIFFEDVYWRYLLKVFIEDVYVVNVNVNVKQNLL